MKPLNGFCKRVLATGALVLFSNLALATEGPVNLNTADATTLAAALQGVGPAKAEEIVRYREEQGPFETVEELLQVKGIGPSLLSKNRERLTIDGQ